MGQVRKKRPGCSSQYIGVYWCRYTKKWKATVRINGRTKYVGAFDSEEEAAYRRDQVAYYYLGKNAFFNFPSYFEEKL